MVLGAILRYAQRRELIAANPIDGVERHPVRYSGDYDICSREEIDAIDRHAPTTFGVAAIAPGRPNRCPCLRVCRRGLPCAQAAM
jgi:hypothetical protein